MKACHTICPNWYQSKHYIMHCIAKEMICEKPVAVGIKLMLELKLKAHYARIVP